MTPRPPPPHTPVAPPLARPVRDWAGVLEFAGYPPEVVTLDFETFYETKAGYGLKELTVAEYIADERFEILGLAVHFGTDVGRRLSVEETMRTLQGLPTLQSREDSGRVRISSRDGFSQVGLYPLQSDILQRATETSPVSEQDSVSNREVCDSQVEFETIWTDDRTIRPNATRPTGGMQDLRPSADAEGSARDAIQITCGPRPRDGEGSGPTLHELQPTIAGDREPSVCLLGGLSGSVFFAGEQQVAQFLEQLTRVAGRNLGTITTAAHNCSFDAAILSRRYGLHPKYLIDTVGLARQINSRRRNGLEHLAKEYGLGEKGETKSFDGLSNKIRWTRSKPDAKRRSAPVKRMPMTDKQQVELAGYALNDAELQAKLLPILLPKICRPELELNVIGHTIRLATQPTLILDFERAESIIQRMEAEADAAVQKVMVCYGD